MASFRYYPAVHPEDYVTLDTQSLRDRFLIDDLFAPGEVRWRYCGDDRLLLAGVCPTQPMALVRPDELGSEPLLERREIGIVNIGKTGEVRIGNETYQLNPHDGLYISRGAGEITLSGEGAIFYCAAAPAHKTYPTRHIRAENAKSVSLGSRDTSNERTIMFYVAPGVTESCQLMMGITSLAAGSVWNTMPCHLHLRRMEAYLYCDLPEDQMIVHLMGKPQQTRHLVMRNRQAVISPSWSIHCAAGTSSYSFVWTMVGENQEFADMQAVATKELL